MAIEVRSTNEMVEEYGIKVLVHGPSGSGKTRLCGTTGDDEHTIIISAERGLLSLRDHDIDAIEVTSIAEFRQAQRYVQQASKYRWVILDSVSEIAEVILEDEKEDKRDPRRAYGEMADRVFSIIRQFRNLPTNVVMTAKQGREEDNGSTLYVPMMPGNQLTQNISYMFDEVFALRTNRSSDGELESVLQTQRDQKFEAKDRSGALERFEEPNLEHIYGKILESGGVGEAKPAGEGKPRRSGGNGHAGRVHWTRRDLSDSGDQSSNENWQTQMKRFWRLFEEIDVPESRVEEVRETIEGRHNVDSWRQIPAALLEQWNDQIEKKSGESDGDRPPERLEWAEQFTGN